MVQLQIQNHEVKGSNPAEMPGFAVVLSLSLSIVLVNTQETVTPSQHD